MLSPIKQYRLLREIGGGGFATVYLAQDENLRREVAVKVLHANLAGDSDFRRFFEREAHVVAALEHLAVVPIYDYGEINGQLYLVMRYMRGGTLADRLEKSRKALALSDVIKLLNRLAPTLDAMHQKGIIHRDLKPSNILYDDAGSAFIADFGIARMQQATVRLTQTGLSFGTPQYSSPEQITGEGVLDHRSDIYTLGIIVYELLTGEYPYWSDTPLGWVYKHLEAPVPNIRDHNRQLPDGVQTVLAGMLAKRPTERYASVDAIRADLERAATGQAVRFVTKPHPPSRPLSNRRTQEHTVSVSTRSPWYLAILAVSIVIGIFGWVLLQNGGAFVAAEEGSVDFGKPENVVIAPATQTPLSLPTVTPILRTSVGATLTPDTPLAATIPVIVVTSTSIRVDISEITSPTIEPSATFTPVPTSTMIAATPTTRSTIVATPTLLVATLIPPTLAPTQVPVQSVIVLLEPGSDSSFALGETVTFRWQGGGPLQGSQYYDLRVWREGAPHYGVASSQTTQLSFNTNAVGTGTFFWSVAVVDNNGATTIVSEATARTFSVNGGNEGNDNNDPDPSPQNPQPNATVTAPPY